MPTPNLSTRPVTPEKLANVTKKDIELHERLGDEACAFERQAKAKRKQQADVKAVLMAWVMAKRKAESGERTVTRSGYRLSIVTVKKGVSWAKEFVAAMGDAAAEKLRKNAGEKEKLTVEKI